MQSASGQPAGARPTGLDGRSSVDPQVRPANVRPVLQVERQARFWRAYLAAGFLVMAGESIVAAVYVLVGADRPNGSWILAIAAGYLAISVVVLSFADWLSRQAWRSGFSLWWASAACLSIAGASYLDGGVNSPLFFLLVLPVMWTALVLAPRSVAVCSGVAIAGLLVVALPDLQMSQIVHGHFMMFSALLVGVVVLAVSSAAIRARLESVEADLAGTLRQQADLDGLTGCANQRVFYERLGQETDRAITEKRPLSMLVCDIDLFKSFNDSHGHPAGDAALTALGRSLRSTVRSTDTVARIGGDEFGLLLADTTETEAATLAHRIVRESAIATPRSLSLSIGVAQLEPADPSPAGLIRHADAALYDAKAAGRHTVVAAGMGVSHPTVAAGVPGDAQMLDRADRKLMSEAVRQARRESEESRRILDTLIDDSPVGFAFIDRDLRVVRLNPALAAVTGARADDQVGRVVSGFLLGLVPAGGAGYRRILDERSPVLNLEGRGPTPSDPTGTHDWLVSLYPVGVPDDTIGIGVVAIDITDRKRLERAGADLIDAVVAAIGAMTEARDPYTAGHQHRVGEIASAIADELGYDEHTTHGIMLAGAIHDIGKISVPAEILSRPGRLSDAEMDLIRTHPTVGYTILRDIEFPWPIAQMVGQHHERFDGSGYPLGLHGDQISVGARIIAVADVLEAMAAHRPYRAALGVDEAFAKISTGRGGRFDPVVVDACLRLFRGGPLAAELTLLLQGRQDGLSRPAPVNRAAGTR